MEPITVKAQTAILQFCFLFTHQDPSCHYTGICLVSSSLFVVEIEEEVNVITITGNFLLENFHKLESTNQSSSSSGR
jgi:hypothetical protein